MDDCRLLRVNRSEAIFRIRLHFFTNYTKNICTGFQYGFQPGNNKVRLYHEII